MSDMQKPASRTVLVTGATGFIGQHLCRRLLEQGDGLIVLSRDTRRAQAIFGTHASVVASLDEIVDHASAST